MTTSEFRTYLDTNGGMPPDCVLGHIAWYSVEEAQYDAAELEARFGQCGLDPHLLPNAINPTDAFEKASKEIEGHRYPVNGGYEAEVLVHEAARDSEIIHRQISRKVRDAKQREVRYEKVGELVFYKPQTKGGRVVPGSSRVRAQLVPTLDPSEYDVLQGVLQKFDAAFTRYRDFHDAQKIRGVMRAYFAKLQAVLMKASVYFVHVEHVKELEALAAFAALYDTIQLTMLPLPDLPSLREEVSESFQDEAVEEFKKVVAYIAKLRETRKNGITPQAWSNAKAQYDEVVAKASTFTKLLHVSQERTAGAAEAALLELKALRDEYLKTMGAA